MRAHTSSVLQILSPVEPIQTLLDLLPEPLVEINVMFHELLDVFRGVALVLGRSSLHFCLQLRGESKFHDFLA